MKQKLLERLECSIVNLSYVMLEPFRLDAEYYSKENLLLESLIKNQSGKTIAELNGEIDCSAFYPSITGFYSDDRTLIPFLRVNEISRGLVVLSENTVFLPRKVIEDNSSTISLAYPGDIIIAKGGNTLAKVGLVTEEYPEYATCRDVIILRTKYIEEINKYYLWSFLHSHFGQDLMWRSASQTGQPHLTLPIIANMHIPQYSSNMQMEVEKLYVDSIAKQKSAIEFRKKATQILKNALKVETWKVGRNSKIVRSYKDISGFERIDAEYYHPKFDDYLTELKNFKVTYIPDEYDVFKNSGTDYADGLSDVGVIKTKQLTNEGVNIANVESYFDYKTCLRHNSTYLKANDVVFATMGVGSLGKIGLFSYDGDRQFVTDSTLRIYRRKDSCKVTPEVLCTYFQSDLGQELIYRYVVGSTGIINIYDDDIARIPIPIFDDDIQKQITECIRESYKLRVESIQLLENARNAVEIAINMGEEAALKLFGQLKKDNMGITMK